MESENFQHIATRLRPRLMKLCQRFFDHQHMACDAEDAVQETLLRLWQLQSRQPSGSTSQADRQPGSHEALAVMIAKNVCIDILRRQQLHPASLDEQLPIASTTEADQQAIAHDAERLLQRALDRLPATQRRMLLMRSEGMSMAEIAAACGTTTNSTKTMVCAARRRMVELLQGSKVTK